MSTPPRRHRSADLLLATLAASLGTFASPAAHAAVVTKALNLTLTDGANPTAADSKTTPLDFNGDGTNDFSFAHSTSPTSVPSPVGDKTDYNGKLTLDAATAAQFLAVVKDNDVLAGAPANYAETLAVGSIVGAGNAFIGLTSPTYDHRLLDSSGADEGGAFSASSGEVPSSLNSATLYVGFAFGNAAIPNYGYLEFTGVADDSFNNLADFGGDLNGATLGGVAYETTPGAAITIVPITVPEPASLAVLCLAGVTCSRRRRTRRHA